MKTGVWDAWTIAKNIVVWKKTPNATCAFAGSKLKKVLPYMYPVITIMNARARMKAVFRTARSIYRRMKVKARSRTTVETQSSY